METQLLERLSGLSSHSVLVLVIVAQRWFINNFKKSVESMIEAKNKTINELIKEAGEQNQILAQYNSQLQDVKNVLHNAQVACIRNQLDKKKV